MNGYMTEWYMYTLISPNNTCISNDFFQCHIISYNYKYYSILQEDEVLYLENFIVKVISLFNITNETNNITLKCMVFCIFLYLLPYDILSRSDYFIFY